MTTTTTDTPATLRAEIARLEARRPPLVLQAVRGNNAQAAGELDELDHQVDKLSRLADLLEIADTEQAREDALDRQRQDAEAEQQKRAEARRVARVWLDRLHAFVDHAEKERQLDLVEYQAILDAADGVQVVENLRWQTAVALRAWLPLVLNHGPLPANHLVNLAGQRDFLNNLFDLLEPLAEPKKG